MELAPATGLSPTSVQRLFEPNRLAPDCQASAYEEVLPVVSRATGGAKTPALIPVTAECNASRQQGGKAA